jgi:hypothetical protein
VDFVAAVVAFEVAVVDLHWGDKLPRNLKNNNIDSIISN